MLRNTAFAAQRAIQTSSSRWARSLSTTTHLVVNAVGTDRPGIVSEVTKHVVDAGGNVGDSQAARLGHHFSLMMLLTVPSDKLDALKEIVSTITGINASIFETEAPVMDLAKPAVGYSGYVTVSGADQPGIVHKVTAVLAQNSLSIAKLKTGEDIAPYGGTTLFHMQAVAHAYEPMSKDFSPAKVRDQLEALGDALNCDVELEDMGHDDASDSTFFSG